MEQIFENGFDDMQFESFELVVCGKCNEVFDDDSYSQHIEECFGVDNKQTFTDSISNGITPEEVPGGSEEGQLPDDSSSSSQMTPSGDSNDKTPYSPSKKEEKRYECDICQISYKNKDSLNRHVNLKHGTPSYFQCNYCQQQFSNKAAFKRHVTFKHENPSSFHCDICSTNFTYKESLKRHIVSTHERPLTFKCNLCEKAFNHNFLLDNHIINSHTSIKAYRCDYCDFSCMRKATYQSHIKKCDKQITDSDTTDSPNKSIHQPIVYSCPICNTICDSKKTLVEHIKSHNNVNNTEVSNGGSDSPSNSNSVPSSDQNDVSGKRILGKKSKIIANDGSAVPPKKKKIRKRKKPSESAVSTNEPNTVSVVQNGLPSSNGTEIKLEIPIPGGEQFTNSDFLQGQIDEAHLSGDRSVNMNTEENPSQMKSALAKALETLYQETFAEDNEEKYKCELCSVTCLSIVAFNNHIKRHK